MSQRFLSIQPLISHAAYYNLDGNLANPRAVIPYSADGSIKPLNLHGGDISDHSYSLPTVLLELGDSRTDKKLFGKVDLWLRDRPRQLKCQRVSSDDRCIPNSKGTNYSLGCKGLTRFFFPTSAEARHCSCFEY